MLGVVAEKGTDYESNAWETASVHSEKSRATSHTSALRTTQNRPDRRFQQSYGAPSIRSSVADFPPGSDYWRDGSPLGPSHSSRNLRHIGSNPSIGPSASNPYFPSPMNPMNPMNSMNLMHQPGSRVQSMAGLSMWGDGSVVNGGQQMPYLQPMMTGSNPGNPFGSPAPSEHASVQGSFRPPNLYPPYAQPAFPMMGMGMGAPRGSMMSLGLGPYGNVGGAVDPRMSSYSLATTANPLTSAPPLVPSEDPNPGDDQVALVLRRYLAAQDLMRV